MSEHHLSARAQARAFVLKTYLSSGVAVGALAAALAWPGSSQAACTGSPTVTCSGTTTGTPNGFGTGTEDNLTINVQNGASVIGTGAGGVGIAVRTNDTVNNSGAVTGTDRGINANTGLNITNNMGATITGTNIAGVSAADVSLGNAGMITGGAVGVASTVGAVTITSNTGTISGANAGSSGVSSANGVTITNNTNGTISGDVFGISSSGSGSVNVTNSGGTISATGLAGVAVNSAGTGVINLSNTGSITSTGVAIQSANSTDINITSNSGTIAGASGGVVAQNSANPGATVTITNIAGGKIQGTGANSSAITDNTGTIKLTNSGTVTTATNGNGTVVGGMVNVTNNVGGLISSTNATFGTIFANRDATVNNFGSITAVGTFGIAATTSLNVTNSSGGNITATGAGSVGILNNGTTATIMNDASSTISGVVNGINTNNTGATIITNTGTISNSNTSATPGAIRANFATITNSGAGTITGVDGIIFRNAATTASSITDSGTITGTGGTAIHFSNAASGNTLELGAGFAINGMVSGGANNVLKLGASGNGTGAFNLSTIGPQYQNFTAFSVEGGVWNTTGTFGQTQTWNVNGGTLAGTGTFAGITVNNGGTLSPGSGGLGTLTANGSLALQSGSLYLVNVNSTTSTKAVVNGTTTISSGSTVDAVFQGTNFQNQYTILTTNGGRTGTFGSLVVMNLPSFMTATLVYLPTEVDLDIATSLGQIGGLTGNQSSVVAGLDRASNSGGGLLSGLSGLTPAQIPGALDALSGEGTTGTQETALGANTMFLNAVAEQGLLWLNSEAGYSFNSGGDRGGALNYAAGDKRRQHPALKAIPVKAPVEEPPRWRSWAVGFDGSWKLAGEAGIGSADLSHHTAGGAAGVDYQVNRDLIVGFAAGGSTSGFSVSARATSGSVDGAHLGAYAVARWGSWYTSGALTAAAFDNRTSRTIAGVGPTELATASFKSDLFGGRFELGRKQVFAGFAITPFAALQFAELWQDGYTESSLTTSGTPGVLGLTFQSHRVSSLPTFLGAQFDTHVLFSNGALWTPFARISWVHEFEPTRDISATFLTLANSTFTVDGPRAARDAARIDIGSKLAISRNVSLFGTFDGEFSDRSQLYSGNGGLRVLW